MDIRQFLNESRNEDGELSERQRVTPQLAFSDEERASGYRPGGFKVGSAALKVWKDEGMDVADMMFKEVRDAVNAIPRQDLAKAWGMKEIDKVQDFIAGKPRPAFNAWMRNVQKVGPKFGRYIRRIPENTSLLYYLFMTRVSGADMARIIFKRYFETQSGHPGELKSKGGKKGKRGRGTQTSELGGSKRSSGRMGESLEEASIREWELEVEDHDTGVISNGRFKAKLTGIAYDPDGRKGKFTATVEGTMDKKDWANLMADLKSDGVDAKGLRFEASPHLQYLHSTDGKTAKVDREEAEVYVYQGGKEVTPKLFMGMPPALMFSGSVRFKTGKMTESVEPEPAPISMGDALFEEAVGSLAHFSMTPAEKQQFLAERIEQRAEMKILNSEYGDFRWGSGGGGGAPMPGEYAIVVSGGTFGIKDDLKNLGLRFDGRNKTWSMTHVRDPYRKHRGSVPEAKVKATIPKVQELVKRHNDAILRKNQGHLATVGYPTEKPPKGMRQVAKAIESGLRRKARLDRYGITVRMRWGGNHTESDADIVFEGQTYPIKDILKRAGFRFQNGSWSMPYLEYKSIRKGLESAIAKSLKDQFGDRPAPKEPHAEPETASARIRRQKSAAWKASRRGYMEDVDDLVEAGPNHGEKILKGIQKAMGLPWLKLSGSRGGDPYLYGRQGQVSIVASYISGASGSAFEGDNALELAIETLDPKPGSMKANELASKSIDGVTEKDIRTAANWLKAAWKKHQGAKYEWDEGIPSTSIIEVLTEGAGAEYITFIGEFDGAQTGPSDYFMNSWRRDADAMKAIKSAMKGKSASFEGPRGMITFRPASQKEIAEFKRKYEEVDLEEAVDPKVFAKAKQSAKLMKRAGTSYEDAKDRLQKAYNLGEPALRSIAWMIWKIKPKYEEAGMTESSIWDKPQYQDDFKAGWEYAKKKLGDDVDSKYVAPKAAFKRARVSKKHGISWIDGYAAWIDYKRGATATSNARDAKKLGLFKEETGMFDDLNRLSLTEKQWIQKAIKNPGRVRKYLGVPEGQNIPSAKIEAAIKKLKAQEDRSKEQTGLLRALILAKRLQRGSKSFEAHATFGRIGMLVEENLTERKLSKVKKSLQPHMWVISKDSAGGYLVTIGDPRKTSSKIKFRTSDRDEIRHWVKYEMPGKVSLDHVFDATNLKLVPDVYSQWFVDNMMEETGLAEAKAREVEHNGKKYRVSGDFKKHKVVIRGKTSYKQSLFNVTYFNKKLGTWRDVKNLQIRDEVIAKAAGVNESGPADLNQLIMESSRQRPSARNVPSSDQLMEMALGTMHLSRTVQERTVLAEAKKMKPGEVRQFDGGNYSIRLDPQGFYTAVSPSSSKSFKTEKGAMKWLRSRGLKESVARQGDVLTEGAIVFRDSPGNGKMVGKTWRLQWSDAIWQLEELPQKGKKKLGLFQIQNPLHYAGRGSKTDALLPRNVIQDAKIGPGNSYGQVKAKLISQMKASIQEAGFDLRNYFHHSEEQVWYLNVMPEGVDPMQIDAKDFVIHSEWTKFGAYSPDSDMRGGHDPSYSKLVQKSTGAARKLYKILKANPNALKSVPWAKFSDWLKKNKIGYEYQHSVWH